MRHTGGPPYRGRIASCPPCEVSGQRRTTAVLAPPCGISPLDVDPYTPLSSMLTYPRLLASLTDRQPPRQRAHPQSRVWGRRRRCLRVSSSATPSGVR